MPIWDEDQLEQMQGPENAEAVNAFNNFDMDMIQEVYQQIMESVTHRKFSKKGKKERNDPYPSAASNFARGISAAGPQSAANNPDPVDTFMDNANASDNTSLVDPNPVNLSEPEVVEIQTALNLLGTVFQKKVSAPVLKVDGVFGPATYARWRQFYESLPLQTQRLLPQEDNPLIDLNGSE